MLIGSFKAYASLCDNVICSMVHHVLVFVFFTTDSCALPFSCMLQGGRTVNVVHIKGGVVIVSQDIRSIIEIAKLANLRAYVEDAWKVEVEKKKPKEMQMKVALTTTMVQRTMVGRLLKKVTYACWPGVTMFGLVPWPSDTGSVAAPSLVYNQYRFAVLLGE